MTDRPRYTTIRISMDCRAMLAKRLERLRAHPAQQLTLEDAIWDLDRHDATTQGDALTTARTLVRQLETAPAAGRGAHLDTEPRDRKESIP